MTFKIEAPHPAIQVTTFLPNPQLGDSTSVKGQIVVKRKMDGSFRTYVQGKSGRRTYIWQFNLTRVKALELRALILNYFARDIKITYDDVEYIGNFTSNPFEFEAIGRAADVPGGEIQTISLEFEA